MKSRYIPQKNKSICFTIKKRRDFIRKSKTKVMVRPRTGKGYEKLMEEKESKKHKPMYVQLEKWKHYSFFFRESRHRSAPLEPVSDSAIRSSDDETVEQAAGLRHVHKGAIDMGHKVRLRQIFYFGARTFPVGLAGGISHGSPRKTIGMA